MEKIPDSFGQTNLQNCLSALEVTWLNIIDELATNGYVLNGVSSPEDIDYTTLDVPGNQRGLEIAIASLTTYMSLLERLILFFPYIFDTNDINNINDQINLLRSKIQSDNLTHNDIVTSTINYNHVDKIINPHSQSLSNGIGSRTVTILG